jgi:hypothetical protein
MRPATAETAFQQRTELGGLPRVVSLAVMGDRLPGDSQPPFVAHKLFLPPGRFYSLSTMLNHRENGT